MGVTTMKRLDQGHLHPKLEVSNIREKKNYIVDYLQALLLLLRLGQEVLNFSVLCLEMIRLRIHSNRKRILNRRSAVSACGC
jgi:hypothetical protein